MNVAIIPARGGSKRIAGKNIKPFLDKPIIAWSIAAAQESGCFDSIVVSTDDPAIAEVAAEFGADVPFLRPAELSDDHTGTIPVIKHAVQWLSNHRTTPENVCCIYATAPFVRPGDLRDGLHQLLRLQAKFAFSVTSFPYPVQRALKIDKAGFASMLYPEHFGSRSQDLEDAYHDAGQFYWGTASAWLTQTAIFGAGACVVRLPRERVQDIDTPEDWSRAELMCRLLNESDKRSPF